MKRLALYVWSLPLVITLIIIWANRSHDVALLATLVAAIAYLCAVFSVGSESLQRQRHNEEFLDRYEKDLDRYDDLTAQITFTPTRSVDRRQLVEALIRHRQDAIDRATR